VLLPALEAWLLPLILNAESAFPDLRGRRAVRACVGWVVEAEAGFLELEKTKGALLLVLFDAAGAIGVEVREMAFRSVCQFERSNLFGWWTGG
jgi:hypothetical protein